MEVSTLLHLPGRRFPTDFVAADGHRHRLREGLCRQHGDLETWAGHCNSSAAILLAQKYGSTSKNQDPRVGTTFTLAKLAMIATTPVASAPSANFAPLLD